MLTGGIVEVGSELEAGTRLQGRRVRMWFRCCQRRRVSLAGGPGSEPSEEVEQFLEEEQIERWGRIVFKLRRLRFKQREWAFLGQHLRSATAGVRLRH